MHVNTAWKVFQTSFINILDEVAPVKEIRVKQRTELWMNNDILDMLKERDRALYNFRKSGSSEDYKIFCVFKNTIQELGLAPVLSIAFTFMYGLYVWLYVFFSHSICVLCLSRDVSKLSFHLKTGVAFFLT